MTATVQIRPATITDIPLIGMLLQGNGLHIEDLARHVGSVFVAEQDGVVIGAIGMEKYGRVGLLRSAVVAEPHRSQGIGERLVARLENYARECGFEELVLLTTSASHYFARQGFVEVGRGEISGPILNSTQFRGSCPASATAMRKVLRNE